MALVIAMCSYGLVAGIASAILWEEGSKLAAVIIEITFLTLVCFVALE